MECQTGGGKTSAIGFLSRSLSEEHRVLVVVPNKFLKYQMELLVYDSRSLGSPENCERGLFVYDYDGLRGVKREVLQKSVVFLDEVHLHLENEEVCQLFRENSRVAAVSGTLGGRLGL